MSIIKRTTMKFRMADAIFDWRKEKRKRKKNPRMA
jgi:hypothetical protein